MPRHPVPFDMLLRKALCEFLSSPLRQPCCSFRATFAQEKVDLNVIHKIKTAELGGGGGVAAAVAAAAAAGGGFQIMDTMYNLTDRYGPRLTNSPQFRAAGDWAVGQLKEWGLSNVHLENSGLRPTRRTRGGARFRAGRSPDTAARWSSRPTCRSSAIRRRGAAAPTARSRAKRCWSADPDPGRSWTRWHGKLKGKIVSHGRRRWIFRFPPRRWRIATPMRSWQALVPEILPPARADAADAAGAAAAAALANMTPEERQAFHGKAAHLLAGRRRAGDRHGLRARAKAARCLPATARRAPAIRPRTCLRSRSRRKTTIASRACWSTTFR